MFFFEENTIFPTDTCPAIPYKNSEPMGNAGFVESLFLSLYKFPLNHPVFFAAGLFAIVYFYNDIRDYFSPAAPLDTDAPRLR